MILICLLLSEHINVGLKDMVLIGKQIEDRVRLMDLSAHDMKLPLHFVVYHLYYEVLVYIVSIFSLECQVVASIKVFAKLDIQLIGSYLLLQVSRVTVGAKEVVEAAGDLVRRVYYNKLGLWTLVKPEWFEKKGWLLPKVVCEIMLFLGQLLTVRNLRTLDFNLKIYKVFLVLLYLYFGHTKYFNHFQTCCLGRKLLWKCCLLLLELTWNMCVLS